MRLASQRGQGRCPSEGQLRGSSSYLAMESAALAHGPLEVTPMFILYKDDKNNGQYDNTFYLMLRG
jgi:hypothetical protein